MYGGHLPCETKLWLSTGCQTVKMSVSMESSELVADPVGHISISGVHGRDELEERLANPPARRDGASASTRSLFIGAAIGAAIMFLLKR
jgi:hypothetical protein